MKGVKKIMRNRITSALIAAACLSGNYAFAEQKSSVHESSEIISVQPQHQYSHEVIKEDNEKMKMQLDVYTFPHAKRKIIHIPQTHYKDVLYSPVNENLSESQKKVLRGLQEQAQRTIQKSQLEVILSAQQCHSMFGVNSFFYEGLGNKIDAQTPKDEKNKSQYLMSGQYLLNQGYTLLPAESERLNALAFKALESKDEKEYARIKDLREDYAIEQMAKDEGNTQVVVYGGNHNFLNNIEKWNKTHPNQVYSLYVFNLNIKETPKE